MAKNRRVILLRHGETDWNAQNRTQGVADVPLNANGIAQAKAAAQDIIANFAPFRLWSSDLSRAVTTAHMLADKPTTSPLLREINLGAWDGENWDRIAAQDPSSARKFSSSVPEFRPPGGESFTELATRARRFIDTASIQPNAQTTGNTVMVAHQWIIAALLTVLLEEDIQLASRFALDTASSAVLEDTEYDRFRLRYFNAKVTTIPVMSEHRGRLIFVRHGQSESNAKDVAQGKLDAPLSAIGRAQAQALGNTIRRLFDSANVAVFASPLQRAVDTAKAITDNPTLAAEISELDIGDWSGLDWPTLTARDPAGVRRFHIGEMGFQPPNGETMAELTERVKRFLSNVAIPTARTGQTTVVVAHIWVIRVVIALLLGFNLTRYGVSKFAIDNCTLNIIELCADQGAAQKLVCLNQPCL